MSSLPYQCAHVARCVYWADHSDLVAVEVVAESGGNCVPSAVYEKTAAGKTDVDY